MIDLRRLLRLLVVAPLAALSLGLTVSGLTVVALVVSTLFVLNVYLALPWETVGVAPSIRLWLAVLAVVALVALWMWVAWRTIHDQTVAEAAAAFAGARRPADEREQLAASTVTRLAEQLGVQVPAVRITDADHPLCYTVRYPTTESPGDTLLDSSAVDSDVIHDASPDTSVDVTFVDSEVDATTETVPEDHVVVVSTGLLDALEDAQLQAVLAHELAHVANGDLGLLNRLMVPLFYRDRFRRRAGDSEHFTFEGAMLVPAIVAEHLASLAISVFTRGREYTADRAAARLIGDPAALASALERLNEDVDGAPRTDMRTVAVLNVLPSLRTGDHVERAPTSHPPTERRIERLRTIAAEMDG